MILLTVQLTQLVAWILSDPPRRAVEATTHALVFDKPQPLRRVEWIHFAPLLPRPLAGAAAVGDLVVIEGAGAYCSSMSTKNYNSFPEAAEVMLDPNGVGHLIRRRQPPEEIWANEVTYKAAAH